MPRIISVPVKDLVDAKQRLVPALAPEQRRALAAAMLEDVLTAIQGARVDAVWVVTRDAEVTALAASRSGLGTNGVALSPPDAMPLRFGEPSFEQHVAAAKARGLTPRLLDLPGLALDVDGPEDLRAILTEGGATASARLAAQWAANDRGAHSRAHAR